MALVLLQLNERLIEDRTRFGKLESSLDMVQGEQTTLAELTDPRRWQVTTLDTLEFCEVTYALADATFRERLQEELWFFYDKRGWLCWEYQRLGRYGPMITSALRAEGLPVNLVYLFIQESGLNPIATSWAKAKGLPQFMLTTARRFHLAVNSLYDERCNPLKAVRAACQYLKELYSYFSDWLLALASYNHGETAVRQRLQSQGVTRFVDLFVPSETHHYVFRIIALAHVYERNILGDFHWLEQLSVLPESQEQRIHVRTTTTLVSLSQQLKVDVYTFKILNPHLKERLAPGRYPVNLPV